MENIEDILNKINKQHIFYHEKDFIRTSVTSGIFKKIIKGVTIISLFSICAFGINKNSSINTLSSKIYNSINDYYISFGINKNFTDIATFSTFGIPLYFLARRKKD
ncbi:MAG: hypothetical protein KKA65_04040 [Nanoarchaeota archaeon]|nr:hypothetical protein [Nanoarchaeota archaeon]MBU4242127.1 hypothetical protein [Nanoarchaeota archaeon]MBU4352245.1 hypothetical protein [Nanoarchaeota archaeon]MBU4456648.1 hypothetical protein [Nanoarchaeota archaeon]MCG2719684.1 hypothetical protein [Nanoarchaeota archaeon]